MIASRPPAGWPDLHAFDSLPVVRAAELPDSELQQLQLRTRYFRLRTEVDHAGAEVVLSALLDSDSHGPARLVARRWTHDE